MTKSRSIAALYFLLIVVAAASMVYYIAGAVALREEFFHGGRYARAPFDVGDDAQTITDTGKEATDAGLAKGDVLVALNSVRYAGKAQLHDVIRQAAPGQTLVVLVRGPLGKPHTGRIRLAPFEGPGWSVGGYVAFLAPVLGMPLLGLLIGYWVVFARPADLNAWLVLFLLAFPETFYGNLDWNFWPSPWYLYLFLWHVVVQSFAFAVLLWFGFLFPERWRMDLRFPWFKYAILAVAFCCFTINLAFYAAQYFVVSRVSLLRTLKRWEGHTSSSLMVVCILLFLVAIFDKLRSASTADARRRLRVLVIGSGLSLGPLVLIFTVVPLFGMDPGEGNWFMVDIPMLTLFPLTLAYVLVVQRAMDIRILLRLGTKYLFARATLLVIQVAVVAFLILRFIIPMMQRKEHPWLNFVLLVLCIGALPLVFFGRGSLSRRLQRWLDKKFFREAYDSEVVLSELSSHVRQVTERSVLIDTVLRRISEVLHVPQAAILLRGANVFHLQQSIGMDFSVPVVFREQSATVQNLMRTNQPATVYHDRPEEWFTGADAGEKTLLSQMHAELLLPLPGRAHMMGLIALGPKRSEEPYTPTDLRILQSVAAQTGLNLEIADLVQTLADEAAQRVRMTREVEIAREVQQRMFPQNIPVMKGVSLAGMCRPALEVGGDYYDLIELEDGNLGFAIGDVSGKGISAALIMASLRASLRGLILDDPGDLARMMQKVNRLVYEASSSSRYATFFFGIYAPGSGEFRYVNGGHNPPIVVKGSTGEVLRLAACGPVVGLLPFADYEAQSLRLEPGDVLIGYTDGISEAMTADDEEWGDDRMLAAAPCANAGSASDILEAIFRAADAFTAGAEQHDDMTILVMQLGTR